MLENSECREIKNSVTSSESVKNHIAGKLLIKAQSKVQEADKGRWTGLAVINPLVDDYAKITKPKYLLICKACLWCASFINGQLASTKCPLCHNGEVDCIPIAEDENCLFDYSHSRGADGTLNISNMESSSRIEAKTCGCREKSVKIAYSFVDTYHSLCLDKKDIMLDQIQACERLLKYTTDETDKTAVIKEIAQLKMTLDLLP